MKGSAVFLAFALFLLLPTSVTAADCQFVLGFKTLRDLISHDIVGECLENESYNEIGDSVQHTTGGLLVWRKADNWTAFTDGYRTWINGPNGLVQRLNTERFEWEADFAPGGGIAAPTPTAMPISTPKKALPATPEEAIAALPWVKEEPGAAETLRSLTHESHSVFWAWFEEFGDAEAFPVHILERIIVIAKRDEIAAREIVQMPFMKRLGYPESVVLYLLSYLADSPDSDGLQQLLSHPKLRGGITSDQTAFVAVKYLEIRETLAATAIESLPWVHEGVAGGLPFGGGRAYLDPTAENQAGLFALAHLAIFSTQVFMDTVHKSWIQDYVGKLDMKAIHLLNRINRVDESAALKISGMPFLDYLDAADVATLEALLWLLTSDREGIHRLLSHPNLASGVTDDQRGNLVVLILEWLDPETMVATAPWVQDGITTLETEIILAFQKLRSESNQVLSHPALRDGVAESEKSLVVALDMVLTIYPKLSDILLDPQQASIEQRTILMPQSGEVSLSVVRLSPGTSRSMELLEFAVRTQEEFMAVSYPRRHVTLLIADFTPFSAGIYSNGLIFVDPVDDESIFPIAHEVAHHYWQFSPAWLGEGGAEVLRLIAQNALTGAPLEPISTTCEWADNLVDLERAYLEVNRSEERQATLYPLGGCSHFMGSGLFLDLFHSLGVETFRQGFRGLYVKLRDEEHIFECAGPERGVCYLKAAFVTDASPAAAAIAEPIINRWYYGSEQGPQ